MEQHPELDVHAQRQLEHERIMREAVVEWQWWSEPTERPDRYGTKEARDAAIKNGALVEVAWQRGVDNGLFGISTNLHTNDGVSSRFLRPEAHKFLYRILSEVQEKLGGTVSIIRPIITSMHRIDDVQEALTESEEWYRAAPAGKSSHAAGAAFDIQAGKYYVSQKKDAMHTELVGTWRLPGHTKSQAEAYNDMIRLALEPHIIAGTIHVIEEHTIDDSGKRTLAVFHICIAPTIEPGFEPSQ